ncbi:MAG: threonine--tRNA ligase [Thermoplasmata archaeon]|nr:MAG: threonine--tRNA ligase [Thermoplasmata archaeon]
MRLLFIHADFMEFETKKKTKFAEELTEDTKKNRVEEALVIFTSVEKQDEGFKDEVVKRYIDNLREIAEQLQIKKVLVYPYVHLTSSPSNPEFAREIVRELEDSIRNEGYDVTRAPFGWYKSFNLKAKGHPLSELSREIMIEKVEEKGGKEEKIPEALRKEKELHSEWFVLTPHGELVKVEDYDFSKNKELETFYKYERGKSRKAKAEPPHVRLMQELELVDYEPGSDPGNFRWYPKGFLIKNLLERHISNMLSDYGAMQVETPVMYDFLHPQLSKYLNRFPARQYLVKSDEKNYFLRFAACFGQYLMGHDMTMSYKHLPLKLYELTHYSFRREQSGELSGLRRLRAFTMPDMHTLAADLNQAKEEFKKQYVMSMKWMEDIDVEYEVAMRFVSDFYYENEDFAKELVKMIDKPVLLELWKERFFYFIMKFEFSVNDALGNSSTLSTVQIDVENTKLFDITYVDKDGKKKNPLLLHASIPGAIDRDLYAILERQAIKMKKGGKGKLPFWLSPTQIRLIPVSEEYLKDCEDLANQLHARVDIDDRDEKVGRKIRDAEKEWINMIIVLGAKEKESKKLPVRFREGDITKYTIKELSDHIKKKQNNYPFEDLTLPILLSKRPIFRG